MEKVFEAGISALESSRWPPSFLFLFLFVPASEKRWDAVKYAVTSAFPVVSALLVEWWLVGVKYLRMKYPLKFTHNYSCPLCTEGNPLKLIFFWIIPIAQQKWTWYNSFWFFLGLLGPDKHACIVFFWIRYREGVFLMCQKEGTIELAYIIEHIFYRLTTGFLQQRSYRNGSLIEPQGRWSLVDWPLVKKYKNRPSTWFV